MSTPTTAYLWDGRHVDVPSAYVIDWQWAVANGDTNLGLADWYTDHGDERQDEIQGEVTDESRCTHGSSVYVMNESQNPRALNSSKPLASTSVCNRRACVLDAMAWVERQVGEAAVIALPLGGTGLMNAVTAFPQLPEALPSSETLLIQRLYSSVRQVHTQLNDILAEKARRLLEAALPNHTLAVISCDKDDTQPNRVSILQILTANEGIEDIDFSDQSAGSMPNNIGLTPKQLELITDAEELVRDIYDNSHIDGLAGSLEGDDAENHEHWLEFHIELNQD